MLARITAMAVALTPVQGRVIRTAVILAWGLAKDRVRKDV